MTELNVNDLNTVAGGASDFDFTKIPATHTVVSGDTLYGICQKYGLIKAGYSWMYLYNLNKQKIDDDAKRNGVKGTNYYDYIYPGQVLKLK